MTSPEDKIISDLQLFLFLFRQCFLSYGFNLFLNEPWFLHVCSTSLLKTPWEKKKLLVTSNFSFSHSVFYPFEELSCIFIKSEIVVCKLFQLGRVNICRLGEGYVMVVSHNCTDLTLPKPALVFMCLQ